MNKASKITKEQIKVIHSILPVEIIKDKTKKAAVVQWYTKCMSLKSTKDLTFDQANALIVDHGGVAFRKSDKYMQFNRSNQHNKVLSLLHQLKWVKTAPNGAIQADLEKLKLFLKSPRSPVKKPLIEMSPDEVTKLIHALTKIFKSDEKASELQT